MRSAAALSLAPLVLATPLLRRQDASVPDLTTDLNQICSSHTDFSTLAATQYTWTKTNAGHYLDTYIKNVQNGNADEWVDNMYRWAMDTKGPSPMDGCGTIGSGCPTDLDCETFFNHDRAGYFWSLYAVEGLHKKFSDIHEKLQDAAIDSVLTFDDIKDDFSDPQEPNIAAFLGAAFVMGSGIAAGAGPAVGGALTVMIGIFSAISNSQGTPNQVDEKSLKDTLHALFDSVRNHLEDTVRLATGNTAGGDYTTLPNYGVTTWESPVANFFSGGDFMISDNSPELLNAIDAGLKHLNDKILDVALQSVNYKVMADYRVKDAQAKCTGVGEKWLDLDGGRCFHLIRLYGDKDPGNTCSKDDPNQKCGIEYVEDDVYNKLTGKYNFDLAAYYTAAYECAMVGGGDVDPKNLPIDGSVPKCFFNPRAFKGTIGTKAVLDKWDEFTTQTSD